MRSLLLLLTAILLMCSTTRAMHFDLQQTMHRCNCAGGSHTRLHQADSVWLMLLSLAGKWGQLGHGDTSKRTVGRAVKQLKHLSVLQAVCGDETLVVLTCHRPHTGHNSTQHSQSELAAADALAAADMRSNSSASLPRSSSMLSTGSRGSMQGRGTSSKAAAGIGDADNADLSCMDGVDWVDVDGQGPFYCPQPRSGYARKVCGYPDMRQLVSCLPRQL